MTATDGGKDEISVDFDWFYLMTSDPHRCTAFYNMWKFWISYNPWGCLQYIYLQQDRCA